MEHAGTDYFHGKLDRKSAEERLTSTSQVGSFLLRETERKTGGFVLSYLGRNGINHFKITNVYGSYFIGGKQFDSLSDLIDYYSSSSDLLTNERLLYPIPPPEPIQAKERLFISILPYTKLAQSDELSFQKGELFILQNELGDGWLWCRDVRSGESGMVFSHLVEEVQEDLEPNEVFPWFHARLSKADAVNKLAQAGPGSYLVRPSDNSPGNYTLFYHVGSTIQRFLIVKTSESRYTMGGKCFDSLGQIIDLYQSEQIIEGHVLQFPIITSSSETSVLANSMRSLKVREKAQDIYHTVKMSREAAKKKQLNDVKGWLQLKKSYKRISVSELMHKKWKSYYFVLNSRDHHLYYYEKPQQTKPKGLIDLSYCYLYKIHESLLDWPQCFQLIENCLPCFANHFYLRCDDVHQNYTLWINAIRKFTSTNQTSKKTVNTCTRNQDNTTSRAETFSTQTEVECSTSQQLSDTFEYKRSIYLNFVEAHSLKPTHSYFIISYNQDIRIAKTRVKSSPSALFNDDCYFALENLDSDIKTITVSLHQYSKKPKGNLELAYFSIDLNRLNSNGEQIDHWFDLHSMNSSTDLLGRLRLRISYSCDIIMGLAQYASLEDLVCDPSTEVIGILNQFCHRDHLTLARALSNIFRYKKSNIRILKTLIERETSIENETASSLFRTSSLSTALIESYMRVMCQTALTRSLREPVKKLLDDKISCDLNPSRVDSHNVSEKACENLQNLLDLLDEIIGNIYDAVDYYPLSVRYLFSCLQNIVENKWPNEEHIRTRVVSGFLFLRLICPTILNPKQFNLINEAPSENAIRNLTLVAKCLQNLANLVETSKSNNSLANSILSTLDDYAIYPLNQSQPNDNYNDSPAQTDSILAFILSPQIESWMEVVNPFILKNKRGLVKFIDELCNVDYNDLINDISNDENDGGNSNFDRNNNSGSGEDNSNYYDYGVQNPANDLAIVHSICESYRKDLENLAKSSQTAKRLLTILTILTQHKQYYSNLRRTAKDQSATLF